MAFENETLIPKIGVVTDIRVDTPDVKTFRVVTPDGKKAFDHKPGQCAMLSVPGVGEAMFSITSSPTNTEYMEFSIKKCGCVTEWLHSMEVGQQITIRGPYGNAFPVDSAFVGKDMLFIVDFKSALPTKHKDKLYTVVKVRNVIVIEARMVLCARKLYIVLGVRSLFILRNHFTNLFYIRFTFEFKLDHSCAGKI